MTIIAEVIQKYPLPIDAATLKLTLDDIEKKIILYEDLVKDFEKEHECDLEAFQKKVEEGELPEHPSWEIAIEWGTAVDELERLRVIKRALQWILNFLS
ncbi:MAG: hypothetical protein ACE5NP_13685 [Anaerolineae bacterium]